MSYLTDGRHLYEVVNQQVQRNWGCHERSGGRFGSFIRSTILRDCVSEECGVVDDLTLAALTEVQA